ncbi:Nucleoside-diphosphate-sugar epimerase [Tenacibaculum sp. MAR_2009_124]|uniref:NAD-dependent epimerase/dehydratase family protein n=1 Tax=Tenacibaculum sp. MAR_2009_124 TaxID=1250059 RepID=UPI000896E83C|nr:NAD-dependent epimerase/dehydratase family protein [Tenacibaculum sp. MAR_2009_124]SEC31605.1 Nucleoside-diphosphate-sugar epimerase [Tenacibaculum sp. MAR_2009_124]
MILVTGGTGLVGSHLLYHLALLDEPIIAIYRSEEKIKSTKNVFSYYSDNTDTLFEKIQWVQADITDIPSLNKVFEKPVSKVYHCAALVSFDPKDYKKMRRVNIDGTANIVNFCVSHNVERLCFVSSIAAVGDSINGQLIHEENEWIDAGDQHGYAITKYGAEMEVWRGSQEGLTVVIVNPGVILGSGFWQEGSGKLFTQVYNNFKFYTEGVTGFVDVNDVAKVMISLINSPIQNERFILVSENKSFKEVLTEIALTFDKTAPSIKIGKFLTEIVWRLDWFLTKVTGKTPLLTKNSARSSHHKSYYTSKKIQQTLNFEFMSISKSITSVCEDYKKDL